MLTHTDVNPGFNLYHLNCHPNVEGGLCAQASSQDPQGAGGLEPQGKGIRQP